MREAVSINLGDFLEAGGPLGGLWGAPGPKTSVCEGGWHDFGHLRGCPGEPWSTMGTTLGASVLPGSSIWKAF